MRTARAMGIATVAVFSDADADAPFVRDADEAVRLPGARARRHVPRAATSSIAAARRTGADAVHPGYGFLSENAGFARACADAGLDLRRPAAGRDRARWARSSRRSELMAAAGVPVLPGRDGRRRSRRRRAARARPTASATRCSSRRRSAAAGAGMRIVARPRRPRRRGRAARSARRPPRSATAPCSSSASSSARATSRCRSSATRTAPSSHLFERECSIQRRHQKIVEEAPSPARRRRRCARELGDAAVAAAQRDRLRGRRHRRVRARRRRQLLLPRGEHPAPGRAPGHRDGHRPRPRRGCSSRSPRASRCHPRCSRAAITRPRDRGPALRRGRRRRLPPVDRHARTGSAIADRRRRARRRAGTTTARRSTPVLRRDARQGDRVGADARRGDRGGWSRALRARRAPRRRRPTATCSCGVLEHAEFGGRPHRHRLPRPPRRPSVRRRSPATTASPSVHAIAAALAAVAAERGGVAAARRASPPRWRNVGPRAPARSRYSATATRRGRGRRCHAAGPVDGAIDVGRPCSRSSPDAVDLDVRRACAVAYAVHRVGDRRSYVDSALGIVARVEVAPRFPLPDARRSPGSLRRADARAASCR